MKVSRLQRHLFMVRWANTTRMLNPDIGGQMTKAIVDSGKTLKCKCCRDKREEGAGGLKVKADGSNIEETIRPQMENMTIIMEIYKYCGKEMNIVVTFDLFRKINLKI